MFAFFKFIEMYNISTEEFYRVFEEAKLYRPNRKTVLNNYETRYLINNFLLLEKHLKTSVVL